MQQWLRRLSLRNGVASALSKGALVALGLTVMASAARAQCPGGYTCETFNVKPGLVGLTAMDDGASSWMYIYDFAGGLLGPITGASNGQMERGPVQLAYDSSSGALVLVNEFYVGAKLPWDAWQQGGPSKVCFRVSPDPVNTGSLDCTGGSDMSARLTQDSNFGGGPSTEVLTQPDGMGPTGAGTGSVRVLVSVLSLMESDPTGLAPCDLQDYSGAQVWATAMVTSTATSDILQPWMYNMVYGMFMPGPSWTDTSGNPQSVTLGGQPFDCPNWGTGVGSMASVAAPLTAMDFNAPLLNVPVDVAMILRLQLEPAGIAPPAPPANDDCASATVVGGLPYVNSQDTRGATLEAGEVPVSCAMNGPASVWYEYTPATAECVIVDASGSDYDTVISAHSGGSCGALAEGACNDDDGTYMSSNFGSILHLSLPAGVPVRLRVAPWSTVYGGGTLNGVLGGNLNLSITTEGCPTPPPACPAGYTCETFGVLPGLPGLATPDDGRSSWVHVYDFSGGLLGLSGATNGQFESPQQMLVARSDTFAGGQADLLLVNDVYVGMKIPFDAWQQGSSGKICFKISPDPVNTGQVDCDGGSDYSTQLLQDSQFAGPPLAPVFTQPAGGGSTAAGSASLRVRVSVLSIDGMAPEYLLPCTVQDFSSAQTWDTALTTSTATSEVDQPWLYNMVYGGFTPGPSWTDTSGTPQTASLTGVPFSCVQWGLGNGPLASASAPLTAMDFNAPVLNVPVDVAMILRLQLEPQLSPPMLPPAPANNECSAATVIGGVPYADVVDTTGATLEAGEPAPSCAPTGSTTVWYTYTPAANECVLVDTSGSDYDTVVSAYSGSCGAMTETACNDDDGTYMSSNFGSILHLSLTGGVPVSLQVSPYAALGGGTLNGPLGGALHLSIQPEGCPPTPTPTDTPTNTDTPTPAGTATRTPIPTPTCIDGVRGGLTFNGVNQSVDGGTWSIGGDQMSVALWANVMGLSPQPYPTFLSKWDNADPSNAVFALNTGSGMGQVRMFVYTNDGTLVSCDSKSQVQLATNQWHHVAATLDGSKLRCYVDGVQVGSVGNWPAGKTIRTSAHHVRLAALDSGKYLKGQLDDVRVYSRGLSATEISQIYNGCGGDCYNLSANLEAWWKLDEGSGLIAADSSGNGHTGALVNGPTWSDAFVCCLFDPPTLTPTGTGTNTQPPTPTPTPTSNGLPTCGVGDARTGVTLSAAGQQTIEGGTWNFTGDQLSVALWAKVTSLSPQQYPTLVSKWDNSDPSNAVFVLNTGNGLGVARMFVYTNDGTLVSCDSKATGLLSVGTWYHVAATLDGSKLRCYVNGALVGIGNWPAGKTIRNSAHHVRIGGRDDGKYLSGEVDDVVIYDSALSAGQVAALYNAGIGTCQELDHGGAAAWWKLNEGTGTTAADGSGNGNTGTLVNGATWTDGYVCCAP